MTEESTPKQPDGSLTASELVERLYDELHALARRRMRGQAAGHTLQTTAVVNEAFLRLNASEGERHFHDERHFFRAAALAMHSVLVDHARRKRAAKREGERERRELDGVVASYEAQSLDVLALDEVLQALDRLDPQLAEVARLRFFAGLTVPDVARVLEISVPTVERRWRTARAFLASRLELSS